MLESLEKVKGKYTVPILQMSKQSCPQDALLFGYLARQEQDV